jgi:hypothetical protein
VEKNSPSATSVIVKNCPYGENLPNLVTLLDKDFFTYSLFFRVSILRLPVCEAGLPDFSWYKLPKREKNIPYT